MKKTFSKKMIYAVIIILIIMLITIAICCTPSSLIGKSVLIRLAVTKLKNFLCDGNFKIDRDYVEASHERASAS